MNASSLPAWVFLQFKATENIYINWEPVSFPNPSENPVGTPVCIYNWGLLRTRYKKNTLTPIRRTGKKYTLYEDSVKNSSTLTVGSGEGSGTTAAVEIFLGGDSVGIWSQ